MIRFLLKKAGLGDVFVFFVFEIGVVTLCFIRYSYFVTWEDWWHFISIYFTSWWICIALVLIIYMVIVQIKVIKYRRVEKKMMDYYNALVEEEDEDEDEK